MNNASAWIFGYSKNELMNKKINAVMPTIYATHHDNFLLRYIDTQEATLLNLERFMFGKHKNGYF